METSTPSDSSQLASPEAELAERLEDLKDLFSSPAWHLYQEELVKVKRRVLEDVARTRSTEDREYLLSIARGLTLLLDPNFTERALQDAGQTIDNPEPPGHPMPLDSEGRRGLRASQRSNH